MAKTYRPYVPEQDLLLPPSLRDWLPEDHLAFFVSDLIDQLDLSAITAVYEDEERGCPPCWATSSRAASNVTPCRARIEAASALSSRSNPRSRCSGPMLSSSGGDPVQTVGWGRASK